MLLNPNTGLIIWTLITFVLLLIVLSKVAWRPLLAMLDARETSIREAMEKAEKAQAEAQAAAEENKKALAEARAEAQAAINKAREDAERVARDVHTRAEAEAQQLLEQARQTIQQERNQALQALRQQTAELVVLAAGQLIEENLDSDKNRKIVDDFIARIPSAQQN
ncbi:MAG: F0F1 ATP synthase subunit B [Candidatus Latescibacterota bacterium]|jgi:F-type H+-transporting ATPase subunit b